MFDRSGSDRKINFFLRIFFVNYAKMDVYFRKNRRLFLYKVFFKLNFKLAQPLRAFYWAKEGFRSNQKFKIKKSFNRSSIFLQPIFDQIDFFKSDRFRSENFLK